MFNRVVLLSLAGIFAVFSISPIAYAQRDIIYWAGCGITKKSFMKDLAMAYAQKTGVEVKLQGGGATRGIRDTAARKLDIGGTCRMALPRSHKSELYANLHPVAWDALTVIVHKSNPINSLTMQQIKDIYAGKISNWSKLGGPDHQINLYTRRGKISGVGYAIRQYVFKDAGMEFKGPREFIVKSSGPLEKACEKDPYALGITGISSAHKRNVKILQFDGKSPTFDNVKNGSYGLYRPLYLVLSPTPKKQARDFLAFATSEEGRDIIRKNGTVPYRDAPGLLSKLLIYGFDVK